MSIHDKKEFGLGLALLVGFFVALFGIFSPLFDGRNALDYLDGVFNSISKHSAYYIPAVAEKSKRHDGSAVTLAVKAVDPAQAARMAKLFTAAGASVTADGADLSVSGDLGKLLTAVLADADRMFKNDDAAMSAKYGEEGRRVLHDWHQALSAMTKDLNQQEKYTEAKALRDVQIKAVEPAYNYFGVQAVPMSSMIWIALAALVGYVVYTIWYGFAILFLFEGWGLKLEH